MIYSFGFKPLLQSHPQRPCLSAPAICLLYLADYTHPRPCTHSCQSADTLLDSSSWRTKSKHKTGNVLITRIEDVYTHLCERLLIRSCCAPGAKHKGDVSSALYVCSHCGFSLIRASSSMHLIAPRTVWLSFFLSLSVSGRNWRRCTIGRRACTCARGEPNKLHSCSLALPLFYERRPTSKTKGNGESSSKDWIKAAEGSTKWLLLSCSSNLSSFSSSSFWVFYYPFPPKE